MKNYVLIHFIICLTTFLRVESFPFKKYYTLLIFHSKLQNHIFYSEIIANYSGHVSSMLYSGHFHKCIPRNLTIFKTATRERNNVIMIINIISFYCLQNIRHNFKPSSFCGNLYFAPDNKSLEMDALLGVVAGIVVDDCWLKTNKNVQITTKVLLPNKSHLRMDLWPKNELQTYQTFEHMCKYSLLKLKRNHSILQNETKRMF